MYKVEKDFAQNLYWLDFQFKLIQHSTHSATFISAVPLIINFNYFPIDCFYQKKSCAFKNRWWLLNYPQTWDWDFSSLTFRANFIFCFSNFPRKLILFSPKTKSLIFPVAFLAFWKKKLLGASYCEHKAEMRAGRKANDHLPLKNIPLNLFWYHWLKIFSGLLL